jgi:hypothetical protein
MARDQSLSRTVSYRSQTTSHNQVVQNVRRHRNGQLSESSHAIRARNPDERLASRPRSGLPRQSSTSTSTSRRSQLVDLVVEDTEAERREQQQARLETGSDWPERDALYLQYVPFGFTEWVVIY